MKKIIALFLSLMLILGCAAYAETKAVSVNTTVMGMPAANLLIEAENADDGCASLKVSGHLMDKTLDAALQLSADGIAASVNGEVYKITYQEIMSMLGSIDLSKLAQAAEETTEETAEEPAAETAEEIPETSCWDEFVQNVKSLPSRALALLAESLRVSEIASDMSIVTVTEGGNICLSGNVNTMKAFAVRYLRELAADEQALVNLSKTALWSRLGMPSAAQLSALADKVEAFETDMSASVMLRICPFSGVYAEVTMNNGAGGDQTLVLDITGDCITARVTEDGRTTTSVISLNEKANGKELEVIVWENGEVISTMHAGYTAESGKFTAYLQEGANTWSASCAETENGFRASVDMTNEAGATLNIASMQCGTDAYATNHNHIGG